MVAINANDKTKCPWLNGKAAKMLTNDLKSFTLKIPSALMIGDFENGFYSFPR